jgi:hypothetical protein
VAALLRRAHEPRAGGRLRVGALEIDPAARDVRLRGVPVVLSQKEFALLGALAAEPTRVLTKAEFLRDVWGLRAMGATRTLDSYAIVTVLDSRHSCSRMASLGEAEASWRRHGFVARRFLCPLSSRSAEIPPAGGGQVERKPSGPR